MRISPSSSAARWLAAVLATAWLATAAAAPDPRSLPGGVTLRMTVPELQQAQPTVKRVPHPARLAGGLVGSWSGGAVDVAGLTLTPTFYFAEGQLERVEYLARDGGATGYSALLAWARGSWGAELGATDPGSAYASWSTEAMDIYLQLASTAPGAPVRLVVKHRLLKDASEL
jgi:hypothetical protein